MTENSLFSKLNPFRIFTIRFYASQFKGSPIGLVSKSKLLFFRLNTFFILSCNGKNRFLDSNEY